MRCLMILANKYRPKSFDEIIGQDHISTILSNSISRKKVHHAYIFCGPSGVGKTTAARVFAYSLSRLLHSQDDSSEEFGEVASRILSDSSPDYVEIDAASNRGIDEIRHLKSEIRYKPIENKYKFIVIDEAHGLTGTAAEALLKMIEEPPGHAIFILCTTEVGKLKQTLFSRCISLRFHKIGPLNIKKRLMLICDSEGIKIDEDAILNIARGCDGNVRLCLQYLETLVQSFDKDHQITLQNVSDALNIFDKYKISELFDLFYNRDMGGSVLFLNNLLNSGFDAYDILEMLVSYLRNLLICRTCKDVKSIIILSDKERELIKKDISRFNFNFLLESMSYLREVNENLMHNFSPQTAYDNYILKSILYLEHNEQKEEGKEISHKEKGKEVS